MVVSNKDINDALLSHRYLGEGAVNKEGLLSHRGECSVVDFVSWYNPCAYGQPCIPSSFYAGLLVCEIPFEECIKTEGLIRERVSKVRFSFPSLVLAQAG